GFIGGHYVVGQLADADCEFGFGPQSGKRFDRGHDRRKRIAAFIFLSPFFCLQPLTQILLTPQETPSRCSRRRESALAPFRDKSAPTHVGGYTEHEYSG